MNTNHKIILSSIGSFILGGLIVAMMGIRHLNHEKEKLYIGAQKVQVIVAKSDLPSGSILKLDDLALKQVFKSAVGTNVFPPEQVNSLKGKRLKYSVNKSDPIFRSQIEN
jgi:Flp pilus assembly protein CpaB